MPARGREFWGRVVGEPQRNLDSRRRQRELVELARRYGFRRSASSPRIWAARIALRGFVRLLLKSTAAHERPRHLSPAQVASAASIPASPTLRSSLTSGRSESR